MRISIAGVATALSLLVLAGPASAAAPVYLNADGNCANPPSSSKSVSVSSENPFVVIDFRRAKLTEGNVVWQLVNVNTGLVADFGLSDPLSFVCAFAPGTGMFWLDSDANGLVGGARLSAGTTYVLWLTDTSSNATKSIRFKAVP
jgi:hypothetical protein